MIDHQPPKDTNCHEEGAPTNNHLSMSAEGIAHVQSEGQALNRCMSATVEAMFDRTLSKLAAGSYLELTGKQLREATNIHDRTSDYPMNEPSLKLASEVANDFRATILPLPETTYKANMVPSLDEMARLSPVDNIILQTQCYPEMLENRFKSIPIATLTTIRSIDICLKHFSPGLFRFLSKLPQLRKVRVKLLQHSELVSLEGFDVLQGLEELFVDINWRVNQKAPLLAIGHPKSITGLVLHLGYVFTPLADDVKKDNQCFDRVLGELVQMRNLSSLQLYLDKVHHQVCLNILSKLTHVAVELTCLKLNISDYRNNSRGSAAYIRFFDGSFTQLRNLELNTHKSIGQELKHIRHLQRLESFSCNNIQYAGFQQLCAMRQIKHLTLLEPVCKINFGSIKVLRQVETLLITNCRIDGESVKHLIALSKLRRLDISGNQIGDVGMKYLSHVHSLESLKMINNGVDAGSAFLGEFTLLKELHYAQNKLTEEGAKSISRLKRLTHLSVVHVFDWYGIRLPASKQPDVQYAKTGGLLAEALLCCPELTHLSLMSCWLKDDAAWMISRLPKLQSLMLGTNRIGREGGQQITRLTGLVQLGLNGNLLGGVLQAFAVLGRLKYLIIGLRDDRKSARSIATLQSRMPMTSVT